MKLSIKIFCLIVALISGHILSGCGAGALHNAPSYDKAIIKNLGPDINSEYDDFAANLFDDRLIFTSKRPTFEGYIQGDDIWFTDREKTGWTKALNYGGVINTEKDEGSVYITPDGYSVYYAQCWTEDGLGDADIYTAVFNYKGKWQNIQNLGDVVNSKYWDSHPFLSQDGQELYFASDRPGGYGGTDIWVSKRSRSGKWGAPRNLGPIVNTSEDEKSPMIAPNGTDLYFSSSGHSGLGGFDLFVSTEIPKKGWSTPKNLGKPFNSNADDMFFRLSVQEDTVFISSNRDGGRGGFDVYSIAPNPFKDTTKYMYFLAGGVFDSTTKYAIHNAKVTYRTGEGTSSAQTITQGGRFRFRTEPGKKVELTASAQGYESRTIQVAIPANLSYNEYRSSVFLPPLVEIAEETVKEKNEQKDFTIVYFEFDKSNLTPQTIHALDVLFNEELKPLVDRNVNLIVQLDAHTDDYGTEDYNIQLSRRRGASVSKYLTSKGISLASVVINAYGEAQPKADNETDEGRQINRRVEIRIRREMSP